MQNTIPAEGMVGIPTDKACTAVLSSELRHILPGTGCFMEQKVSTPMHGIPLSKLE